MANNKAAIEKEIAEYKELIADASVPADEKEFAKGEIADLEKQLAALEKKAPAKKEAKAISETWYIEYLDKKNNFKKTEKIFTGTDAYEKASAWGKKQIPNFNSDMLRKKAEKSIVKNAPAKKVKKEKKKKKQSPVTTYKYKGKSIKDLDDSECAEMKKEIAERRAKAKASGKKSKSKPVIEKITGNVATAVKQAINNESADDIKKDPKKFIARAEKIEKAAVSFLTEMKSILGDDFDKDAIEDEFADIHKLILDLKKKYPVKAANGAKVEAGKREKDYVEYLNEIGPPEFEHPENDGRVPYSHVDKYGTWLKRNDQIAFNVGYQEWKNM